LSIRLSSDLSSDVLADCVVAAQRAGLYGCWFAENPYERSALVSVAGVAKHGPDLHLGVGVLVARLRHPVVIAQDATAADAFCAQPLRIGLGAGLGDVNRRTLGLPKRSGFAVMDEALHALRTLCPGGSIDTTDGLRSLSLVAPGRPLPLLIGAIGPKTVTFAAEHADGVVFSLGSSLTYLEDVVRDTRQIRHAPDDPFELVAYAYFAGDLTDEEVDSHLQPLMGSLLRMVSDNPAIAVMLRGLDVSVRDVAAMHAMIEEGRSAARVVPRRLVEALVLVGSPDRCAERLTQYARTGLTELALGIGRWVPDIRRTMRDVADVARRWGLDARADA
jgi:alkanesulfonate monooxygenase SsuD/methylene tetrahydromethanopterin reductase-like flavin-dependent oxidoreductase (luciferase family)